MKNKSNSKIRILISGGGTAGHIFPAVAIADYIKNECDADFLFIGARNKMEMVKVKKAGYKISAIWIDGLQRRISFRNFILPLKLLISFVQCLYFIINYRPHVVIGTGGFVSGPIVFTASLLNIPTIIHEQNSFPGITNRILSKFVNKVCVSYPNLDTFFKKKKIIYSGNPVRNELKKFVSKEQSSIYFNLNPSLPTILVVGGSLGAEPINKIIFKSLNKIKSKGYQIIWQTGDKHYDKYKYLKSKNVRILDFIDNMSYAYNASDLVISRAGAIAIAEICLLKKSSILIPSPYVSENHQYENAKSLENNEATCLINQSSLELEFWEKLNYIMSNPNFRKKISKNAYSLSQKNAESIIFKIVKDLIQNNK